MSFFSLSSSLRVDVRLLLMEPYLLNTRQYILLLEACPHSARVSLSLKNAVVRLR